MTCLSFKMRDNVMWIAEDWRSDTLPGQRDKRRLLCWADDETCWKQWVSKGGKKSELGLLQWDLISKGGNHLYEEHFQVLEINEHLEQTKKNLVFNCNNDHSLIFIEIFTK